MFQFDDAVHTPAGILADIDTQLARQPLLKMPIVMEFNAGNPTATSFPAIQAHLDEISILQMEMDTSAELAPSPATRVPILGQLWGLIRAEAHNLPLYYVNRHATTNAKINQHLISILAQLAQTCHTQNEQIAQLQAEVAQLRAKEDVV